MANLLYAYSGDEPGAADPLVDASGNGRDVALTGELVRYAAGQGYTYGGALPNAKAFGQASAASESAGPPLAGLQTPKCTEMAWFYRTVVGVIGWVGEQKSGGSGNRGMLVGLNDSVSFRCRNASGAAATPGAAHPAINTWFHLAGTWDGVTVRVFVNGVERASAALAGPPHTASTGSHLFDTVGADTKIRDLRYYDDALSAPEIQALMAVPVTPNAPAAFQGWGVPL